ncbi:TOL protein [Colletotrichum tofieldiae]|uniref:TOL protein n=1 Tax=Colletotrichum tofieldiae TaxID=708197 RepID=A0A166NRY3_9PEZI|nr:TOL protein [Colletotrichum tofieldiae]
MDNVNQETPPAGENLFEGRKVLHPALSERSTPRLDTWEPLWNGVLENNVFHSWQRLENQWMLRCVGGPGSGKTNLSTLVAGMLEEAYNGDKEAVASIFIGMDVTSGGTAFLEDVLTSVFHQLSAKYAEVDGDAANAKYRLYLEAWKHGHRDRHRIRLVRDALCLRLDMLEYKFLVIDDFDRCYPAVDLLLENELSLLAAKGLKVFLTSRISCLESFPLSPTCDSCQEENGSQEKLELFWGCESCEGKGVKREETYTLCEDCVDSGKACKKCGDSANFVQPYNHIDLNLNDNGDWVEQFINYDLECEHGNLGLGSPNKNKPPKSRLGRQLMATRDRKALTELQGRLVRQAEGNVSLARLRLSNEHRAQSAESVFSPLSDVLPVNVVGFFHEGMRRVEEQPPERRDLGFKVIAAVTHYHYAQGIPYEVLDRLLCNPTKTSARQHPVRTQSAPVVPASAGAKRKAGSALGLKIPNP